VVLLFNSLIHIFSFLARDLFIIHLNNQEMKTTNHILLSLGLIIFLSTGLFAQTITFSGPELLGCPTNNSIIINIIPDADIELYYEYGTSEGGPYDASTSTTSATGGQPHEVAITGLDANTRYYYRMQYRTPGGSWNARDEYSFHTQRTPGSTFKFTVTADSHYQLNTNHQTAMQNVKADNPDFHLDLGDTFMPDGATSQVSIDNRYLTYRDPLYLGAIGPTVPIFLASGNHENEEGWNIDDTPFSIAVGNIQSRKMYFPTPVNDGFYSGNTDPLGLIDETTYGDELREDYFAWEWGDALFVVIDEFQYTMVNPYGAAAGEGSDDPDAADQWIWTLGEQQYDWFKQTMENSDARYKFIFSHNMLGGITRPISGVDAGYVRGGAEAAAYFEWGGKNADGSEGFATHRPGWEATIHQIMVENGASAYFHGHDHQYVYETRDGIVYQEVPSPSMTGSGFSGIYTEGVYDEYETIEMQPNAGHLRLTVTPDLTTVEYVRSNQTGVSHTYTILPNDAAGTFNLTMQADPAEGGTTDPAPGVHTCKEDSVVDLTALPATGYEFDHWSGSVADPESATTTVTMNANKTITANFQVYIPERTIAGDLNGDDLANSTDALIILSCDVGIDVSQFCPVNCADVNGDGHVNSTDALIVLSYDAGLTVPYPVGQTGCPTSVTPCPGCSP
jgi:predicted phosphodiesterase